MGSTQLSGGVGTIPKLAACAASSYLHSTSPALRSVRRIRLRIKRLLMAGTAAFVALEGSAFAQAMFTGSIGNVFGGSAPSTKRTWAIAIGGGGAHGIGSE